MTTPALIIVGLNDTTVLPDRTRMLENHFVEAQFEEHDGGMILDFFISRHASD